MRVKEILEGLGKEFDVHDFNRNEEAFIIYLSQVEQVIVNGSTDFQGLDYEVSLQTDFGGVLHVDKADIFRTEEEAATELFKRKLKGKENTSHFASPRW